MKFEERIISVEYAIAAFVSLDEAIASDENQKLVYYNSFTGHKEEVWGDYEDATRFFNEAELFQGLLRANKEPETYLGRYEPFAICYETTVKQLDKVYSDSEIKQLKRTYALEKLTAEDREVLGLDSENGHDVF